jgi:cyclophilin family peptidyl-prolyl cis-trans isomerase/predicted DsbA family dithiol-disulfide isomerase
MKKISKLFLLLLMATLLLSACKGTVPVPENMPTKASEEEIEEPIEEETIEPVIELEPSGQSAEDIFALTRTSTDPLTTDDDRMACTPSEPIFAPLTAELRAQYQIPTLPEITEEDHVMGSEDAIMTVIFYTDFQCPYCALFASESHKLYEAFPDEVRLVYRPLPLSFHNLAPLAAQAAEAAGVQGKFWEMHDHIFGAQQEWGSLTDDGFTEWLNDAAEEIGLDVKQFSDDLVSKAIVDKIAEETELQLSLGINATPSLFINDYPWQSSWSFETLSSVIDVMKAEAELKYECPPFVIDPEKTYIATMETEKGKMVFELFPNVAPLAVNSFVYLSQTGFYDGVTFHRVLEDFMAQGGDPTGSGMSGAGYTYAEETHPELLFDQPYLLAVAKTNAPSSSGSQFFITFEPAEWLNGGYTIMGRLIEGKDVLKSITLRDPSAQPAPDFEGDKIIKITIEEK